MGADGGVTIYKLDEVKTKYAQAWPLHDIYDDWWYLKTITANIDGLKLIIDYSDTGGNTGTENEFWFKSYPEEEWVPDLTYLSGGYKIPPSQMRVLYVLQQCWHTHTEVWT